MNIVIPMAGLGSRFQKMGYKKPKPLIPIIKRGGETMIRSVISNLGYDHNYFLICSKEISENHEFLYSIKDHAHDSLTTSALGSNLEEDPSLLALVGYITLGKMCVNVIPLIKTTDGSACSCLKAKEYINNDEPLIIINCDQIIEDWDYDKFTHFCERKNPDGVLGTFFSNSIKNSYVRLSDHGEVLEVREKEIISNYATNGLHYWKHGSLFVESAEEMIAKDDRVKGEFYVGPTYNYLIRDNKKILFYHFNEHYPIGTPEDLEKYEN